MLKKKNKTSRRRFVKSLLKATASTIGIPYLIPSSTLGLADSVAPSNRITLGCIGTGNQETAGVVYILVTGRRGIRTQCRLVASNC